MTDGAEEQGTARGIGATLRTALIRAARDTAGLVVPIVCPCGVEGTIPCARCAASLAVAPRRVEAVCSALQVLTAADARGGTADFSPLLPVLALGEHTGDLRRLVLAWKNGGQLCLARPFGRALAPALGRLAPRAGTAVGTGTAAVAGTGGEGGVAGLALVPVPSSLAHRLRRGEDHTAILAAEIAREAGGEVVRALALGGGTQAGKGARERRAGRRDRMRVRRAGREPRQAVLVDDVVTTGATLRGARDALLAHGWSVHGALVVAAARVPGGAVEVPGTGAADEGVRNLGRR